MSSYDLLTIDKNFDSDPNEVPNYAFVAFEYFRAREAAQPIQPYLDNQKEINEKMRQVLVDWLVEVNDLNIYPCNLSIII